MRYTFFGKNRGGSITNHMAPRYAKATDLAFHRFSDAAFQNRFRIERELYIQELAKKGDPSRKFVSF